MADGAKIATTRPRLHKEIWEPWETFAKKYGYTPQGLMNALTHGELILADPKSQSKLHEIGTNKIVVDRSVARKAFEDIIFANGTSSLKAKLDELLRIGRQAGWLFDVKNPADTDEEKNKLLAFSQLKQLLFAPAILRNYTPRKTDDPHLQRIKFPANINN